MLLSKDYQKAVNLTVKYVNDDKLVLIISKYIKDLKFFQQILTKLLTNDEMEKTTFLTYARITGSELNFDTIIVLEPNQKQANNFLNCLYKSKKSPLIVDIVDNDTFLPTLKKRLPLYQEEYFFQDVKIVL